jgi:hypothetical protein
MTNLAISPPESNDYDLSFNKKNFDYLLFECLRLKRQRTKDLETIMEKNNKIIAVKQELIDLYLEKNPNVPEVLKSFNRDLMSTVLDYQKKELDGLRATNPVMYISK